MFYSHFTLDQTSDTNHYIRSRYIIMTFARELFVNFTNQRERTILSRLPQPLFAEVITYLDIYSIVFLIRAFEGISKRFIIMSDCDGRLSSIYNLTTVKHVAFKNFADEDLVDTYGDDLVRILQTDSMESFFDLLSGEYGKTTTRLLNAMKPYDTLRLFEPENDVFHSETVRILRLLTRARIHNECYLEYCLPLEPGEQTVNHISSFDKVPFHYKYDEYAPNHSFIDMNRLQNRHFGNLVHLSLFFGKSPQRPVISGIYAPNLRFLMVVYLDKFPLFYDNDFGSQCDRSDPKLPQFDIMHQEDIHWGSTKPTTQGCLMSPEEMRQCDFSWSRCFRTLKIRGCPDELVKMWDFSETETFVWKRSSFQHPQSSPVVQLNTPNIRNFIYEDLLPNPSVPVLMDATKLKGVMVAAYQPGLQLNGILKGKDLEWANIYCYSASKGSDFDMVISDDELWNVDTDAKIILVGCGASGLTPDHGVVVFLDATTNLSSPYLYGQINPYNYAKHKLRVVGAASHSGFTI